MAKILNSQLLSAPHNAMLRQKLQLSTKLIYLEPAKIIIVTKQSPEAIPEIYGRVPGKKWHAQVDNGFDTVRPEPGEVPNHHGSPVMADQEDPVDTQMVKKADEVADSVEGRV